MTKHIDEYGEVGDLSSVKIPPQIKGKLEYHSTPKSSKHINIDTPTNSELEDIFNSYIRVDMAERIDCESAIEEIAKLINKQIIEARIETLRSIDVITYDPQTLEEYLDERIAKLRTTK